IITRRFPLAEIVLYPSLVQGHGAAVQVASGIEYFNETRSADVIIIGRGGGSIEDLWEFNNEMLARRIYASDIPIISAVGHESDFTISDFVSDVRASTPSAAAELAVPERSELAAAIGNIRKRMSIIMDTKLNDRKLKLSHLASSQFLKSPLNFVDAKRLETIQMQDRLDSAVSMILERKNASLKEKAVALNALSPLAVLTRGYSVSYSEDGKPVKSVRCVREGDNIINEISDGVIYSTVTSTKIKRGHKNGKENGKF
ncbi:MAG: exodeoxyribonuclease VII large subunit, partial [Clostridia bacterium]|nr:exodeoxyribonuclease VII large subunit [Clostridia bacterium]